MSDRLRMTSVVRGDGEEKKKKEKKKRKKKEEKRLGGVRS